MHSLPSDRKFSSVAEIDGYCSGAEKPSGHSKESKRVPIKLCSAMTSVADDNTPSWDRESILCQCSDYYHDSYCDYDYS